MIERLRGRAGQKQRLRRLRRTHHLCEHCLKVGKTTEATIVDHIQALANGGSDDDENTQNLCDPCHDAKTRRDFGQREKKTIGTDGWPLE